MPRVKRGTKLRKRHKKIINLAEGYFGRRKNCFQLSVDAVEHAWKYAFVGRKQRKRDFRRLWIQRINAAARNSGVSYSKLMQMLKAANIEIDRKMLAHLAVNDPKAFEHIVQSART